MNLTSINREKQSAKVSFRHASVDYEVILENRSENKLRKEFYDTNCPDHVKTKKQLIQCTGFPIYATRDGDVEKYFYIIEFAGFNSVGGSLDGFTVEIKNNKIIRVSGYI